MIWDKQPQRALRFRCASSTCNLLLAVAAICMPQGQLHGKAPRRADAGPLSILDGWSCVFGGREITVHCAGQQAGETLAWRVLVGPRAIASGKEKVARSSPPGGPAAIPIAMPAVKPGVVVDATIVVRSARLEAEAHQRVYVFSDEALGWRRAGFAQGRIYLFDTLGQTRRALAAGEIPVREVANVAALAAVERGVVVVGESMAWDHTRGLADAAYELAARGVSVLALAPSSGALSRPLESTSGSWTLASDGVTRAFDARFDATNWLGGPSVAARIDLCFQRGEILARVSRQQPGWPWLEVRPSARAEGRPPGKLVVCGFRIIELWEAGPVPRYLLADILDDLLRESDAGSATKSH